MIYEPVPGCFDHRGMDCKTHGVNVAHARARGDTGPFLCVRCMLNAFARASAPVQEWWEAT